MGGSLGDFTYQISLQSTFMTKKRQLKNISSFVINIESLAASRFNEWAFLTWAIMEIFQNFKLDFLKSELMKFFTIKQGQESFYEFYLQHSPLTFSNIGTYI